MVLMKRLVLFLFAFLSFFSICSEPLFSESFPQPIATCRVFDTAVIHEQRDYRQLATNDAHAIENCQHLINYFAPYLGVLALRFTSTVVHELGHAVSYWAIAKEWPSIIVGDDEEKEALVFDTHKFKLFLPNADTMYFCGSTDQPQTIDNRYLDIFNSLMGPISGALFAYGMLYYFQKPLVRYVAIAELFAHIVLSLLTHGDKSDKSDGYWALQALHLPTSWMKDFENNEYNLANSIFDVMNLPQLVDLLMFCKLFQARSDNERIIMLGGQLFFRIMVPYVMNGIKELYQKSIDFARENIDQAEKIVQKTDSTSLALFIDFSRFWLLTVMPVLLMHELIKLNARQPVKDCMTDLFLAIQKPDESKQ